jgi:hypothetical protein
LPAGASILGLRLITNCLSDKGRVSIDSEAGPIEIVVLADVTADPIHVAADLISQAEHDPLAAAVLITDSDKLAEGTRAELSAQLPATKHVERIQGSLVGRQSAIVMVDDIEQGIEVANGYTAEHLEIQTADGDRVVSMITKMMHVVSYTQTALKRWPARWRCSPMPRICRRTAPQSLGGSSPKPLPELPWHMRRRYWVKVDQFRQGRDDLADWLAVQGLLVAESDANFILFGRFCRLGCGVAGAAGPRSLDQGNRSKVRLSLDLDGTGIAQISTGVGFFDHMLTAFAVTP